MEVPNRADVARDNTFDFLRLFAASAVVVGHATFVLDLPFLWYDSGDTAWFHDGVSLFLILSGYLVYQSAERNFTATGNWDRYIINRFVRVAPALWAFTLVTTVSLPLLGAVTWSEVFAPGVGLWLASTALFMPLFSYGAFEGFGTGKLNPHLWTITAEVSFYAVLPIMYWAFRRLNPAAIMTACAAIAVVASTWAAMTTSVRVYTVLHLSFVQYFACFLAGIFLARTWKKLPQHVVLFVLAVSAYVLVSVVLPESSQTLFHPWLETIPLSYATIWFGHHGPAMLRGLSSKIGDWSFGTYIWHWSVINAFVEWNLDWGRLTIPAVLVISWAFGSTSWWIVERRALRRKFPWATSVRIRMRSADQDHEAKSPFPTLCEGPRASIAKCPGREGGDDVDLG